MPFLEQWNLFGFTTKTSLGLDAWQALISSLPLRLLPSYHCFPHSSFLLLSVCRCTRPQSCMLTPVSKRTWVYDKHRSFLFPLPHIHPTPSKGHQGLLQSQREGEKENGKAEQIFQELSDQQWSSVTADKVTRQILCFLMQVELLFSVSPTRCWFCTSIIYTCWSFIV